MRSRATGARWPRPTILNSPGFGRRGPSSSRTLACRWSGSREEHLREQVDVDASLLGRRSAFRALRDALVEMDELADERLAVRLEHPQRAIEPVGFAALVARRRLAQPRRREGQPA